MFSRFIRTTFRRAPGRNISQTKTPKNNFKFLSLGVGLTVGIVGSLFTITSSEEPKSIDNFSTHQLAAQKMVQREMQQAQLKHEVPIFRIVLTGGPCGGKSTALAMISDRLLSLGFRVYRVPEVATLLITGCGLNPGLMDEQEKHHFEGTIIKAKMALEDLFYGLAKASGHPCVIICDRGTMDTAAYMESEDWDALVDEHHWNVVDLRDKRYDAVIHLVTTAIGAESYYTTENNAARFESLSEARDVDFKVLNAWVGHPHLRIVDNSTDFKQKIIRVESIICQVVGAPRPIKSERKFLVSSEIAAEMIAKAKIKVEAFQVEQTYLTPSSPSLTGDSPVDGYNYLRRRGQHGTYTYTHSMHRGKILGQESHEHVILERAISGREYVALLKQADGDRLSVKKKVQCFLWNGNYYELQTFVEPDIGLTIVRTEISPDVKSIEFPWFLNVKGEITGVPEFSSFAISQYYKNQVEKSWIENKQLYEAYRKSETDFQRLKRE